MAYTIKDINEEMEFEESASSAMATVTRTMLVTTGYASGIETALDLLGSVRLYGNYLIRVPPLRHPRLTWTRCSKVSLKPWQGENNTLTYGNQTNIPGISGLARLTNAPQGVLVATYTTPTLGQGDDPGGNEGGSPDSEKEIATETLDFSAKMLTLPGQYYKWYYNNEDVKRPDQALVQKAFPEISLTLVRHRCIRKPVESISTLLGTVNYSSMRIINDWYPPETVLFVGAGTQRRITAGGGFPFYEITYKFLVRPIFDDCVFPAGTVPGGGFTSDESAPIGLGAPIVGDFEVEGDYVGWNRVFNVEKAWWDRLVWKAAPNRGIYLYDQDMYDNGFDQLFNPRAG